MKKSVKKKKRGIKRKITIAIITMGVLLFLCVGIGVFSVSYRQVSAQYTERAFSSAITAAVLVNGDSIYSYLENGKNDEYFAAYDALKELKTAFNLAYLYVITQRPADHKAVYIFDIFIEGDALELFSDLGDDLSDAEASSFYSGSQTFLTGQMEDSTIVSISEYGWLASAFVPIYASDGTITATLGVDISMDHIMSDIIMQTLQILLLTVAIILVFLLIFRYLAGKQILDPVTRLSNHMDGFNPEEGKLETITILKSGDEFQTIAESYNRMVGDIKYYMDNLATVTADRERIATELNVATEIQASMLPNIFPAFPERNEFDIYAVMFPAREVGGDFYDFFFIDKNTLAVVIADVSDKGIPAALFMVIAITLIKNNALEGKPPAKVFETINNLLCKNNDTGMFVTAFMGYIDIPTGRVTYVNAGHNPPLIKQDGKYEFMKIDSDLMLAVYQDIKYTQEEVKLNTGDMLYLYTDGVTEAMNRTRKLFTDKRLLEKAGLYTGCNVEEFILKIKDEIDTFSDGAEQADDITMLAFEMKEVVMRQITIPAQVERANDVFVFIEEVMTDAGMDIKTQNSLRIAVEEIFVNIASYAYTDDDGEVTISISTSADMCTVEFEDSGTPYNPLDETDPDTTLSADEREIGGLGVFMVKQMMDSIDYRYEDRKNILSILLKIRREIKYD